MGGVDAEVRSIVEAKRRTWNAELDKVVDRLATEAKELEQFDKLSLKHKGTIEADFEKNKDKVVEMLIDAVMFVELEVP